MKKIIFPILLGLLVLSLGIFQEADAAIYVKIPNIRGDVTTEGYDTGEWFVADSFSFGVEREMKESGEKAGTEDINIGVGELQEFKISKLRDRNSDRLSQFSSDGTDLGFTEIHFVDTSGEKPICYLKYKLDRAFIKSWSISGDADDRPTEEVSFYYNKIAFQYGSSTDGREFKQSSIMSWDNVKNSPWTDVEFTLTVTDTR